MAWIVERDHAGRIGRIVDDEGEEIMAPQSYDGDYWIEAQDDAARLVAAAPDLLEALKLSIAPVPEGENWAAFLARRAEVARKAIASATGK